MCQILALPESESLVALLAELEAEADADRR